MLRRRNYLIKKKMQLGMSFRFLLTMVLFSLFLAFEVYVTIWPVVSSVMDEELRGLIVSQILFRAICFAFPVLFVMAAFSVIFSHRIAGPVYRLEKTIDEMAQGKDVEPICLRKGDELKDLARKINSLMPLLKERKALLEERAAPQDKSRASTKG